jgi:catechol 2,3-dioxygenase-like lactoylglutathione lyase family enzyme
MSRAKLVPELLCSDLRASLNFYLDLVGFQVVYERPAEKFAYIGLAGAELMLEEAAEDCANPRTWWTAKAEKPYGRGVNLQIQVADVDSIQERLAAEHWSFFRPMEEKWYRAGPSEVGNRQFLVQDPDGYLLRLFRVLGSREA